MAVSDTPTPPNAEKQDHAASEAPAEIPNDEAVVVSSKPEDSLPAPPDGGLEAWIQVLGSWFMVFNAWGIIVIFGVYQAYYERGTLFTQTPYNISWIGSIQSLLVFLLGAVVGTIYDKGYLKALLAMGMFCVVFGHMMLSLCTEYWQVILAQGFVVGIGGACLFVPALAVTQPYFSSRLGLALGVVGTGSSLGCIVYGCVFASLIDRIGFAWTTRTIGFIALATLMVPLAVSKKRIQPAQPQFAAPTEKPSLASIIDGRYILCVFGVFVGYAGCQVTFFYIAYFGQAQGWFVGNLALYLVPIVNAGAIIGRLVPNWLTDKIGVINVVIPGSFLLAVLTLCNLAVVNSGGLICIALFFGILSGIFVSTPPLLFLALTKDKSKIGARMGIAYLFVGLSVLPGGPGAGGVLQHRGSGSLDWSAAWTYAGILQAAAFVVFCVLRVWQGGFKLMAKVSNIC